MIVLGVKSTYKFEYNDKRIHLPRIYINKESDVRILLNLLKKHGKLSQQKMTEETTRVRSENAREFFQQLWEMKLGVGVMRDGKNIVFVADSSLNSILDLNNDDLKKLILKNMINYIPFVAILDRLIDYKNDNKKFTQQNIADDFHKSRTKGNLDNAHPLLRWANDKDWGLVDGVEKKITQVGIDFVENAKKLKIHYISYDVDLDQNKIWNVFTHIVSHNHSSKQKIGFGEIKSLVNDILNLQMTHNQIIDILNKLIEKGIPIYIDHKNKNVTKKHRIIHNITAKAYVQFELEKIDSVSMPKIDTSGDVDQTDVIIHSEILIISNESIDLKKYPKKSQVITFEEFQNVEKNLPELNIKTVVLPSCWSPLKVEIAIVSLMPFVRFGGNLIIENINVPGRIGANNNRYAWLPYDLEKISSVPVENDDHVKGYFTFNDAEEFMYTKKINSKEFKPNKYSMLHTRYHVGNIIFTTLKNNKSLINNITQATNKVQIDVSSIQWYERRIINLASLPDVNRETHIYPILRNIMNKHFGFQFDPDVTGKSGQTDIMIQKPFFCCCEVSTFSANVTGAEKVSEVDRHRTNLIHKDIQHYGKKYGITSDDNAQEIIGAIVIGKSFTKEDGYDKDGAIDTATNQKVPLISYKDLYELLCFNEKKPLSVGDFKEIFFYNDQPIMSKKIFQLIMKNND